ncbi:ABC transporter substrate-binding protein [Lichenifustis flavocetrariae]|uniref:ABC transporter substrate-binding protein n=1 Tax=Lichenifustis flavocetrariae TaxID=2949735 RepID=A0AA41YV78_9HYPH|nr:ABC transporter substrate-binding protein [Lichenifustis flavocetrariae]MCW6507826.1 ABC transporter substrate-binding protein [Lichenifustis flavocetrariae]
MLKLAVPDLISNSYFPAEAAIELGFFKRAGLDVSLDLVFPVDRAYRMLRDGEVDIVAGSAHSALAAFPGFEGVKLLCAQAQGMYWFLVMRADLKAERGDIAAVKGKRIGAAPWVDMGLRQLLVEGGIDAERDGVTIMPVPSQPGQTVNFGLNAAKALQDGLIDGFWANGMAAEVAVRGGIGTVVLDVRRGDGPSGAFGYTFASVAARSSWIDDHPTEAEGIVRAIVETQAALNQDVELAGQVGRSLFPDAQAALITDLIRRDLPFYNAAISRETVASMSRFARDRDIAQAELRYEDVISPRLAALWA